jgi:hypothetical protein
MAVDLISGNVDIFVVAHASQWPGAAMSAGVVIVIEERTNGRNGLKQPPFTPYHSFLSTTVLWLWREMPLFHSSLFAFGLKTLRKDIIFDGSRRVS